MPVSVDSAAASLLAADVVRLEAELALALQQLRITREMLSESLEIAHQSIAYIASKVR
jgi:hypothetical protein